MDAITNSVIIELTVNVYYKVKFPYSQMNRVMKFIKEENLSQTDQEFGLECSIIVGFSNEMTDRILNKFNLIEGVVLTYLYTT